MHLKGLTLKGFKSFADTTTLELEPGMTVVVGPNGSGKSNVVDAIAWVLGAQAPSLVRSQKMDDVIFAGTESRAALGRAEVGLTIDNSDGVLPVEFTEVTISRTLFRTGESEYAINGVPCRLLDLVELLSDSGVGRQQHVIVSQGHIDEVLNARPEDRRSIIEEAAGVLKYRKRKEKAERRLDATEGNLTRVQDLLREVRRQLRPLEKQADAARRHGDLVAELAALQLFAAGRELATLKQRSRDAADEKAGLVTQQKDIQARLAELDTSVLTTEAALAAQGGDDLGDELARVEALRERARGLDALLAERRRGIERERGAFVDQAVIATLESEVTRVAAELEQVHHDAAELAPEQEALAAAESALAGDRARFESDWAEGVMPPSGQAAEVRGELGALRASVERSAREQAQIDTGLTGLTEAVERLAAQRDTIATELAAAEGAESSLVEALDAAEAAVAAGEQRVAQHEEQARAAERDANAWQARVEALTMALTEARSEAGIDRLAELDGVLGTLRELVVVDQGFEQAFAAATHDALDAVVVTSVDSARQALHTLDTDDLPGAVLALVAHRSRSSVPLGASPLRPHVHGVRPELEPLLDALIGGVAVADDWAAAVDLAATAEQATVVTRAGDRFTNRGWRLGAGDTGVTGAALDEARQTADEARVTLTAAQAALDGSQNEVLRARHREADARRALDANDDRMVGGADGLARLDAERRDLDVEREARAARTAELAERSGREQDRVDELEQLLPRLENDEQQALAAGQQMARTRAELEEHAARVGAQRTDLDVRVASINERRSGLERRRTELDERLERHATQRIEFEQRRLELERRETITVQLNTVVDQRLGVVDVELADLRSRRQAQSDQARAVAAELDGLRRRRGEAERSLNELRERANRAELTEAEVKVRLEAAIEATRRDLDTEPHVAMQATCPELPEGVKPAARIRELERELKVMGPINPLALQEFEELQERHEFLQGQLDDIRSSRRELNKVIRAIDEEIVTVFASAFADVADNFEQLFDTLFPGGRGKLKLTDPENLLTTGIEIQAQPSGKNVKKLSLLSGGERTLTAMAFLFAVFRSRPSPFYVMDEVEAALDDINLHRFLGLVDEFRNDAQLLIVSHQKRTMEAADCLYGVSMQSGGSSKVVSEKIDADTRQPASA
ncbi:MAG: chromosome segregation protein SMC [Acidimicrobiales bacterium]